MSAITHTITARRNRSTGCDRIGVRLLGGCHSLAGKDSQWGRFKKSSRIRSKMTKGSTNLGTPFFKVSRRLVKVDTLRRLKGTAIPPGRFPTRVAFLSTSVLLPSVLVHLPFPKGAKQIHPGTITS